MPAPLTTIYLDREVPDFGTRIGVSEPLDTVIGRYRAAVRAGDLFVTATFANSGEVLAIQTNLIGVIKGV